MPKWEKVGKEAVYRFFGQYPAMLDAKNRVVIPARLRSAVEERDRDRFILTVMPDGCLVLYTPSVWDHIAQEIEERARTGLGWKEARNLERELFANAQELVPDRQGRILLPEPLKQRAGIEREVVFVGVRNRIELWDAQRWAAEAEIRARHFEAHAHEVLR
ncbi:MAG: transcriptional regulator MraZ [Planctomycetota bacterium]|nr:MAG: transcriptional regulator MraZ [Planctomycetota bacterium]